MKVAAIMTTLRRLRAIFLLPFMVAVAIPATVLLFTGLDTFDLWQSFPVTRVGLPILGGALICLGLVLMVSTIRLFANVGKGTLAPWNPTQRLVVQGIYRQVRNPMMSGVFFVLLGEALLAASLPLFCWFLFFVIGNAIYTLPTPLQHPYKHLQVLKRPLTIPKPTASYPNLPPAWPVTTPTRMPGTRSSRPTPSRRTGVGSAGRRCATIRKTIA
jgi:protein-S-isoprenylcysteine O-methyltransferase Ste14